jgi:hypothetical protein
MRENISLDKITKATIIAYFITVMIAIPSQFFIATIVYMSGVKLIAVTYVNLSIILCWLNA